MKGNANRLTPEERAFVGAVANDAVLRWGRPSATPDVVREAARRVTMAAHALLSADAGREREAEPMDVAAGREELADVIRHVLGKHNDPQVPVVECVRRLVAQADAGAGEICAACNGSGESGPDQVCAVCRGTGGAPPAPAPEKDAKLDAALETIFFLLRRLVEEAQGETVGTAILRHRKMNRLIEVRDVQLTDPDWFTNSVGVAIRFVRAPEEAEHE